MNIERIKLHHYPASRSARVKWLLHEALGDDFDVRKVALYDAELYQPEFLSLNPNHAVPVLEIEWSDGSRQTMVESAAMIAFLGDAWPEAGLAPAPGASRARAEYLQMLQFGATTMDMPLWQIRIHQHMLAPAQRDARTVARYRAKFADEVEPQLARRLAEAPFACGEAFTAADCMVGHSVFWARGYGLCRDEVFRAYVSRLSKRPAFGKAFADAREFAPEVTAAHALAACFTG